MRKMALRNGANNLSKAAVQRPTALENSRQKKNVGTIFPTKILKVGDSEAIKIKIREGRAQAATIDLFCDVTDGLTAARGEGEGGRTNCRYCNLALGGFYLDQHARAEYSDSPNECFEIRMYVLHICNPVPIYLTL